ncbi:hypothetical protein [Streptomyces sp. NPDC055185]
MRPIVRAASGGPVIASGETVRAGGHRRTGVARAVGEWADSHRR